MNSEVKIIEESTAKVGTGQSSVQKDRIVENLERSLPGPGFFPREFFIFVVVVISPFLVD